MDTITIGMPSNGYIRSETALALAAAVSRVSQTYRVHMESPVGAVIPVLREHIADQAMRVNSAYLMFIDSDIVFPPEAIQRLIDCNKPVVGGDYNYKYLPLRSVTNIDPSTIEAKYTETDGRWPKHAFLSQTERPEKPFEVRAVGAGFMLIRTEILKDIPKPWFWLDHKEGSVVGEDVWFCDKVKEGGFSVWCDPAIQLKHIGTTQF